MKNLHLFWFYGEFKIQILKKTVIFAYVRLKSQKAHTGSYTVPSGFCRTYEKYGYSYKNGRHVQLGDNREILFTCTLCWSWKRTAMLTGWSSPSTVVEMTEEPKMVPKYLVW